MNKMLFKKAIGIYRQKGFIDFSVALLGYLLNPLQVRNNKLKKCCNIRSGVGLEIGPLSHPVVKKKEGKIYYVDYLPTEQLKERFAINQDIDINNIVEIDFIIGDVSSDQIQSVIGPVDYIIACHVLEHVPNTISWLKYLVGTLRRGGIISLVIPDRRHTSDYYRKETTLTQLLWFESRQLTKPSFCQVLDCFLNMSSVSPAYSWIKDYSKCSPERIFSIDQLMSIINSSNRGEYIESHCTVWTYESFRDVFEELKNKTDIPLELHRLYKPNLFSYEFIVQLKRI